MEIFHILEVQHLNCVQKNCDAWGKNKRNALHIPSQGTLKMIFLCPNGDIMLISWTSCESVFPETTKEIDRGWVCLEPPPPKPVSVHSFYDSHNSYCWRKFCITRDVYKTLQIMGKLPINWCRIFLHPQDDVIVALGMGVSLNGGTPKTPQNDRF